MKIPTHADLTALLNKARDIGITRMAGAPATPHALRQLANHIYSAILRQALLGDWRPIGIVDADDLLGLVVIARPGKLHEPSIVIEYDFTRTKRPDIVVACDPVGAP